MEVPAIVAPPYVKEGIEYVSTLAHCMEEHVHMVSGFVIEVDASPVHKVPLPEPPPFPCTVIAHTELVVPVVIICHPPVPVTNVGLYRMRVDPWPVAHSPFIPGAFVAITERPLPPNKDTAPDPALDDMAVPGLPNLT